MILDELIEMASEGYPDGYTLQCWDSKKQQSKEAGDTLALFIVRELQDFFCPSVSDIESIHAAIKAMVKARNEVDGVVVALTEAMCDIGDEAKRGLSIIENEIKD